MRSCIYCGKELAAGEVCDCPQSVARREKKDSGRTETKKSDASSKKEKQNTNPYKTETSYKTGYAGSGSRFERAKTKRRTKKAAKTASKTSAKGFFGNMWRYILNVLRSPVDGVTNPVYLSKAGMLTIAALQGAVLWLCMFFVMRGGAVGPFRLLASALSFNGAEGYKLIAMIFLNIISGAVGGIVLFFLYSGIFWLINRFIIRLYTPYWEFSIRLAATWIPFTVICAIGAVLSILSPLTLLVLLVCGAISVVVLTYEAMRTEWISKSPGNVMYAMMLGYFVFFLIVCYLIIL